MIRVRNHTRRQTIFALAIIIVVLVAGVGLIFTKQLDMSLPRTSTPTVTPGPISVEGTVVCLPHKDASGPQTLECAYGLQSNSGDYYGLRGLDQDKLIDGTLTVTTKVKVMGDLAAPSEDERYGVVGNISVQSIEVTAVSG